MKTESLIFYFLFEALQKKKKKRKKERKRKAPSQNVLSYTKNEENKIATKNLRHPMTWNEWTMQRFNLWIPGFIISLAISWKDL